MGRMFISVGRGGQEDSHNLAIVPQPREAAKEVLGIRDLVLQQLRSRQYDILAVPDELNLPQTIDWINRYSRPGDVALAIYTNAQLDPTLRGATAFYITGNEQRKTQAEQILQAYLRRVPQVFNRGVKSDNQTVMGQLAFCRQTTIPALQLELGCLANPDDRRTLQQHAQDAALGISEGLVAWNHLVSSGSAPGGYTPSYPSLEVIVNGAPYDDKGILLEGNAYVPIDLVDQLGIDLSQNPHIRRVSYRNVVFVRALDLKDFHLSVTMGGNQAVMVRSMLPISANQLEQIMGQGQTSEVQMMMFLKSHHPEGLSRFPDLPKLYREEATIEGVNYDIAFAQMCVETNFLRFGTTVSPEQNNFASLGAIGGGAEGATFSDSRLGVRAQIQHLKAYASTEPLVQAIIDPRFHYIRRGIAPGIHQLSGRWSADANYHKKILAVLKRLYEAAGFF